MPNLVNVVISNYIFSITSKPKSYSKHSPEQLSLLTSFFIGYTLKIIGKPNNMKRHIQNYFELVTADFSLFNGKIKQQIFTFTYLINFN